jgi:hypothetical protein
VQEAGGESVLEDGRGSQVMEVSKLTTPQDQFLEKEIYKVKISFYFGPGWNLMVTLNGITYSASELCSYYGFSSVLDILECGTYGERKLFKANGRWYDQNKINAVQKDIGFETTASVSYSKAVEHLMPDPCTWQPTKLQKAERAWLMEWQNFHPRQFEIDKDWIIVQCNIIKSWLEVPMLTPEDEWKLSSFWHTYSTAYLYCDCKWHFGEAEEVPRLKALVEKLQIKAKKHWRASLDK